jgi:hypothetical protein
MLQSERDRKTLSSRATASQSSSKLVASFHPVKQKNKFLETLKEIQDVERYEDSKPVSLGLLDFWSMSWIWRSEATAIGKNK